MKKIDINHASLFSGIGGFDLASELIGWTNIFNCEIEDFPRKVLKYHFPTSKSYGDITKVSFKNYKGKIDVLTGGFPCQPFSQAGKRKGKEDDRYLWEEMLRAIHEIKPTWVVAENVSGILTIEGGLVFDEIISSMESKGYEVQSFIIPAAGKNAPHRRDRVWIIAYSNGTKQADRFRTNERETEEIRGYKKSDVSTELSSNGDAAYSNSKGLEGGQDKRRLRKIEEKQNKQSPRLFCDLWEKFPIKPPICGRNDGLPGELVNITLPKWRRESLKAYGNAIVPQIAYEIFKGIDKIIKEIQ